MTHWQVDHIQLKCRWDSLKKYLKNIVSYKSILASMFYKVNIIEYFKQQEFTFFLLEYRKSSISVGGWDNTSMTLNIMSFWFACCRYIWKKKSKKVVQFLSRLFPASQVFGLCVCVNFYLHCFSSETNTELRV